MKRPENNYLKYSDVNNLITELKDLQVSKKTLLIAIDGMSGSGKTTLGKLLKEELNANLFHIDDFFKKPSSEDFEYSEYGSNIDFYKIENNIIKSVINKENATYKPFDFKTHSHLEPVSVSYKDVNIIEGSFSMHPYLYRSYDLCIYLKTSKVKQLKRIYKRSGLKRLKDFIKRWIPNENKYNKALKIQEKADIVIKS